MSLESIAVMVIILISISLMPTNLAHVNTHTATSESAASDYRPRDGDVQPVDLKFALRSIHSDARSTV